jgi:two-component system chemotaxis sensor kinase CheA
VQLVVFVHEERRVGLIVDSIIDIVAVEIALERPRSRRGVLGTMVVANRITEFLDIEHVISWVDPEFPLAERAAE